MSSGIIYDSDTSDTNNAVHTTSFTRDASGDLTSTYVQDGRTRTVFFTNDVSGQVVTRYEDIVSGRYDGGLSFEDKLIL